MQERAKTESLGKLMKDLKVGDRSSGQTSMSTAPEDDEDETEEGQGPILDRNDMLEQQDASRFDAFGRGKQVGGAWEDGQLLSNCQFVFADGLRAQAWVADGLLLNFSFTQVKSKMIVILCYSEYAYHTKSGIRMNCGRTKKVVHKCVRKGGPQRKKRY